VDSRWRAVHRLLIVRLDNLGDVILATPAIRALRRALPHARLTLLASAVGAPVAELDPDLDDAVVYDAPWMDPEHVLAQDLSREGSVLADLRRRGFDAAIIFTSYRQSSLPAAYLCYLAGIPLRHAASIDGPGSLLTSRHRHPDRVLHEVERGLDLVRGLGIDAELDDLRLKPREADLAWARGVVSGLGRQDAPVVVIHPGCSCPSRTYPPKSFGRAARELAGELGARIIWTGGAREIELIERIRARLVEPGLSLAGQTDLSRLAAIVGACDAVVTNNTGPMHVAAALGTPVAAIFALTNPPLEWHPWKVSYRLLNHSVECAPCYHRVCPIDHACIRGVTAADITRAVQELLEPGERMGRRGPGPSGRNQ
jgi:lipopolysaccharide heptosyltransferase II